MQHDDMQKKVQNVRLESFWDFWKVQNKAIPTVPTEGQTEKWHSNPASRQKICQNGHNAVREAYGILGGKWEMGQESE
jgi:hypothetical protein